MLESANAAHAATLDALRLAADELQLTSEELRNTQIECDVLAEQLKIVNAEVEALTAEAAESRSAVPPADPDLSIIQSGVASSRDRSLSID